MSTITELKVKQEPKHNGHNLSHFYTVQFSEKTNNRRFRIGIYNTSFIIRNMQDATSPDELFSVLLDNLIDEARRNGGGRSEKFSAIFRSPILHKPIQIPYRDFEQNSIATIMEMFDTVEQSGRERWGRPSLFSQPIHLEIVMGPDKAEALELIDKKIPIHKGSGRLKRDVKHNINRSALIETPPFNKGSPAKNLCLFFAVEMTRQYVHLFQNKRPDTAKAAFQRLITRKSAFYHNKREKIAMKFVKLVAKHPEINLRTDLNAYSVEVHVPMIQRFLNSYYPSMYRLVVFGQYGRYKPLWKGIQRAKYDLPIFLEEGHFIGIRRISSFLGVRNYCVDCESSYNRPLNHKATCKSLCVRCGGKGFEFPCPDDQPTGYFHKCTDCNIIFKNSKCYTRHLFARMCTRRLKCETCGWIYNTRRGDEHICHAQYCYVCHQKHHPTKEQCSVQKIDIVKQKESRASYQLVIYDFECTTHTPVPLTDLVHNRPVALFDDYEDYTIGDEDEPTDAFDHRVNCVSAYLMCSECVKMKQKDNDEPLWLANTTGVCEICGPNLPRMQTWIPGKRDLNDEIVTSPLDSFLRWILYGLNGGVKRKCKTYALAHYSGRYDMHLVAGAIYRLGGLSPKIIRAGNKLYELSLERRRGICPAIFFKDTFNWMSMRLSDLPKALDLGPNVQDKLYFPHGYNRNENLDICRAELPPPEDYFPDGMNKGKKAHFYQWHKENIQTSFCLKEQLKIYCENDVILLAHATVRFQALFAALAPNSELADDIIANSLTIASACIRHFCINHLIPGQVAIIPDLGYHRRDIQSLKGLKFLRWYAHHYKIRVQHRDSGTEGEFRLPIPETGETFRLDGYVKRPPFERDICLEFNGCAWHGHNCVYEPNEICLNGKTSLANMDEVQRRQMLIELQGLETRFFWECEVDEMLKKDPEMCDYFETIRDSSILVPRDALFGGRTGPLSLKCDLQIPSFFTILGESAENFQLLYYDIVSLYPAMNFHTEYPLGHPEVLVLDKDVNWTRPVDNEYRGLLKVFVVAPPDLYLPVIPQRVRGKLIFALCNACARIGIFEEVATNTKRNIGHKRKQNILYTEAGILNRAYTKETGRALCPHQGDDNARGWISIITDIELNLALSRGYRVTHVFNVYNWKEWTNELFRPYVRQFMEMKLHSSGWPDEVKCPENAAEEERRKQRFIDRNRDEYGIEITAEEVKKNPGLRYVSKICLNSMWGRWSLRNNLTKDLITDSAAELHTVLNDPKLEVGAVEMIGKLAAVPYKKKRDFVKSGNKHNVVLAAITTAAARVALYEFMDRVHRSPNCKLLYTDTDSMIFMKRRNASIPFVPGSMLGQMANEYPRDEIRSFYSGGCKQYGLEIGETETDEIRNVLKCRGCTLDSHNEDIFNMERFKDMVNNFGLCDPLVMTRHRFRPDFRAGRILTRTVQTSYRPVFDKAHVDARLDTYPFGYTGEPVKFITNNIRITENLVSDDSD